jgi:hypothetical protein
MATIDYDAVLEDLRAQRDELNAAISAIERLSRGRSSSQGLTGNGEPASVSPTSGMEEREREPIAAPESKQIREDTFFGLSASAAARKYLTMVKRPALTQELVDALKKGGYLTNATNFYSNLYTTLKRSPEFTNLGKGKWGLAEWYPNRPRKKKGSSAVDEPEEGESN